MPSETVYDQAGLYDLVIQWQPGPAGHVQLGVTTHNGLPILDMLVEHPDNNDREAPEATEPVTVRMGGHDAVIPDDLREAIRHAMNAPIVGTAAVGNVSYSSNVAPTTVNTTVPSATYARFDSLWATLDREAINALIRKLRRARKAVYGEDE